MVKDDINLLKDCSYIDYDQNDFVLFCNGFPTGDFFCIGLKHRAFHSKKRLNAKSEGEVFTKILLPHFYHRTKNRILNQL